MAKPAMVDESDQPSIDESQLLAIERRTAVPMLCISAALVPVLITPLLVPLPPNLVAAFDTADWTIWSLFTIEYIARFFAAKAKRRFIRRNLIDLATVLLPLIPHLQFASSARTLRLLRVGRILTVGLRSGKQTERIVNHRSVTIVTMIGVTLICTLAALEYDAEHLATGANILSVGDAFWWAIATVTSVGYGDRYPVTTDGRIIAAALMVIGLSTSGLIAAALASIFIEERTEQELDPQIQELKNRLDSIDRVLELLENHQAVVAAREATATAPESAKV